MQAVVTAMGGPLTTRGHSGVALTAAGRTLPDDTRPVVTMTDIVLSVQPCAERPWRTVATSRDRPIASRASVCI